jgi:cleavage and polyadenylation specificity factor subunit 3
MASKRKASAMNAAAVEDPVDPSDELMFLCLGGGNEVGRSCHIIQYKGKTVMVRSTAKIKKGQRWLRNDLQS